MLFHKKHLAFLLAIFFLAASCSTIPIRRFTGNPKKHFPIPANPVEKEGWELTFQDEFNDRQLNRKKWQTRMYYGWEDKHHGRYVPSLPKEYFSDTMFQFTDSAILLMIDKKTIQIDSVEIPFVTSLLDCSPSFKQQYGYFEIRSRNPSSPGFWPAFWLVSTEAYPPEIDVYEFYTSRPKRWTNTIHYKLTPEAEQQMEHRAYKIPDPSSDFNIYAVEWDENELKFYYNNVLVRTTAKAIETMNVPMHIIINMASERPDSKKSNMKQAVYPNYLEVDYVRAYRKKQPAR